MKTENVRSALTMAWSQRYECENTKIDFPFNRTDFYNKIPDLAIAVVGDFSSLNNMLADVTFYPDGSQEDHLFLMK